MQPYDAYEPCGSCLRHVRREDPTCPFCGMARTPEQPAAPRRIRNTSRAQWLAFGSTLVGMGCSAVVGSSGGNVKQNASSDGSMTTADTSVSGAINEGGQDANADADAAPEASGNLGGPDASCPRSGMFTCGTTECDRATEFCHGANGSGICALLSDLTAQPFFVDSGTCGSCPTCACVPPTNNLGTCSCFEDNFGGLTVACSQGGCYGSPPARLDRAPRVA